MLMGDLVLLQDEVNPVMSALLENGFDVTALHNHFFWDEPRMFYMHVHGHGEAAELAKKLKPAVDLIGKASAASSGQGATASQSPASSATQGALDTAKLVQIVGTQGEQTGPVYKFTLGRNDLKVVEMGAPINSRMGLNTWAAFTGTAPAATPTHIPHSSCTCCRPPSRPTAIPLISSSRAGHGTCRRSICAICWSLTIPIRLYPSTKSRRSPRSASAS